MRSVSRLALLVVTGVSLFASLLAGGSAIVVMVRGARAEAAALRPEYVAATKKYDIAGKLLSEDRRPVETPPLYGFASRLLPPEVTCVTTGEGTTCTETTPAPLAQRLTAVMKFLGGAIAASLLFGMLAGWWLARAVTAPLQRMADVVDRAARENAYSLRVEDDSGLSHSVNELLSQMQQRDVELRRRSTEIEGVNKDLEAFAYSVSHDLRGPLGSIDGFAQALDMDYGDQLDRAAKEYIGWIREGCRQMRELIDGLLQMARLARTEVQREQVDLSSLAASVADALKQAHPARSVHVEIRSGVRTIGDERLLRAVLENLMANAWKFTRNRDQARIEFGQNGGAFFIRDNGAGFDPSHAAKMFRPFQRLHSTREFEGTGIGLATVQKIIERHGGRAWAEGEVEKGATIYFTTGGAQEAAQG